MTEQDPLPSNRVPVMMLSNGCELWPALTALCYIGISLISVFQNNMKILIHSYFKVEEAI